MNLTIEQWTDRIPSRPYATDDFRRGVYRHPRTDAMMKTYVQHNPRALTKALVFDLDYEDAYRKVQSLAFDDEVIPEPSWVTINKGTDHAHVGYLLATPVAQTQFSRLKPIKYAAAIEEALREALGADRGYSGLLTRNPGIHSHTTVWGAEEPYSLGSLAEALPGGLPKSLPKRQDVAGLGRHCTLFEELRHWSYREFRNHTSFETYSAEVLMKSRMISLDFHANPLPEADVVATARSVSKWVWANFDAEKFSQTQANRGAIMTQKRIDAYTRRRKLDRSEEF